VWRGVGCLLHRFLLIIIIILFHFEFVVTVVKE